jgi:hypothetical protein
MLKQLKDLVRDLKSDTRELKKLIMNKKAGLDEVLNLKVKFVVRLLQVIFKRK